MLGCNKGFTLVELVTVIMLLGILSAVALPKMTGASEFQAVQVRDEVASALRYAQKTAISHRRMVCVVVQGDVLRLRIAQSNPAEDCNLDLPIPGGAPEVGARNLTLIASSAALMILPTGQAVPEGGGTFDVLIGDGVYKVSFWKQTGHVE